MADLTSLDTLFKGLDTLINTKIVVGEPVMADGAMIIPLMDVTCGMAAGSFGKDQGKGSQAGGMHAKMSPSAILVIQNGSTKVINVKNTDAIGRLIDIVPDLINKLTADKKISPAAVEKAEEMAEEYRTEEKN